MVNITWKVGDRILISGKASSLGKGKRQTVTDITEEFTMFKGGLRCKHKFVISIQDHKKAIQSRAPSRSPSRYASPAKTRRAGKSSK